MNYRTVNIDNDFYVQDVNSETLISVFADKEEAKSFAKDLSLSKKGFDGWTPKFFENGKFN